MTKNIHTMKGEGDVLGRTDWLLIVVAEVSVTFLVVVDDLLLGLAAATFLAAMVEVRAVVVSVEIAVVLGAIVVGTAMVGTKVVGMRLICLVVTLTLVALVVVVVVEVVVGVVVGGVMVDGGLVLSGWVDVPYITSDQLFSLALFPKNKVILSCRYLKLL